MSTRKQRELEEQQRIEASAARDAGREFFKLDVELPLAGAYREANARYPGREGKHQHDAFVEGFHHARRQRDEYLQEQRELTK